MREAKYKMFYAAGNYWIMSCDSSDEQYMTPIIIIVVAAVVLFVTISALISRYKRCPSDKILVIYGRTGGTSAKCVHGGGAFIWPVIQDFAFLDLKPLSI